MSKYSWNRKQRLPRRATIKISAATVNDSDPAKVQNEIVVEDSHTAFEDLSTQIEEKLPFPELKVTGGDSSNLNVDNIEVIIHSKF